MQNSIQNQQGATLFVAMIMLVIISLIGVTALKNASVEEQMSANLYQKNMTFQASESAVESTINNTALLTSVLTSNTPVTQPVNVNIPQTTAQVTYSTVGTGPCFGCTMGVFTNQRLMITSTGEIPSLNARTTTVHGVVRMVPSLNN